MSLLDVLCILHEHVALIPRKRAFLWRTVGERTFLAHVEPGRIPGQTKHATISAEAGLGFVFALPELGDVLLARSAASETLWWGLFLLGR